MLRFAQKYNKKIMAVLSIVLMVIFVASQATGVKSSDRGDEIFAKMGDVDLMATDYREAKNEWQHLLERAYTVQMAMPRFQGMPPETRLMPICYALVGFRDPLSGQFVND